VFGGIKQGSSIAVGPAVSWESPNRGFLQIKGGYSLRQFKLFQVRYDSPPLFGDRSLISTRLRWQDAPELPLYRRGPDSPNRHLTIGMTKSEWSAFMRTTFEPKIRVSFGSGVEGYSSKADWADVNDATVRLGAPPDAPGLATRPLFVRSFLVAANDTRFSPDYSRTGRLLEAGMYDYHNVDDDTQTFQRFEFAAVQLIPTFHTEEAAPAHYKGALSVFARAWLSHTGTGDEVPFYLMSFLGGGDYLRGYATYRFHDRNALLLGTEYRYAVHKMVDVAVLLEGGTVAPAVASLNFEKLARSAAAGIRVHSKKSGLLRMDVAHGRDGFRFTIGVSNTGS
jgi:hypothetical protein